MAIKRKPQDDSPNEQLPNYKTLSGFKLKEVYTIDDVTSNVELPGEYPFTRGIHRDMFRGRFWTRRQQSGFGTPQDSNARMKFLLEAGQTGLNMDWDVPTELGLDADHPLAENEVGLCGTSLSTLEDMEQLLEGIPLDKVSSTLIIPPPLSAVMTAMYVLVARKRGIPLEQLAGTIMNDAVAQLVGLSYEAVTGFFPLDTAVKIGLDVMEYCTRHMPKWNILNINAYNMRETGYLNAVQEIAFSMSLAFDYIRQLAARGLDIEKFARRIAFFVSSDIDFLEEIAKFRAIRRLWATILRERFDVRDTNSCRLRIAVQTAALPLTAEQPLNNIARTTIQTLAAVLGGVQSIHTTSYDEAYALPSEESHKLSIRIQQLIGYETNVAKTVDPLGGSYAIEWLTGKIEEEATGLMSKIESSGGFLKSFKDGWVTEQVDQARLEHFQRLENGEQLTVGLNVLKEGEEPRIDIFKQPVAKMQRERRAYLKSYRENRDNGKTDKALEQLYQQAVNEPGSNWFESIMQAIEAGATSGEIIDVLRKAERFELPA